MVGSEITKRTQNTVIEKNLQYVSQSADSYIVKSESGKLLTVKKAYTRQTSTRRHYNFHNKWVQLAIIGLPIGGLLTIILSPFVIWNDFDLLKSEQLSEDERIHAKHLLIISFILFLLGISVFVLFIMHLIY